MRESTPAGGLRAVMAAFEAHLVASPTCKTADDARPTLAESLTALGEALGPEGVKQIFQIDDEREPEGERRLNLALTVLGYEAANQLHHQSNLIHAIALFAGEQGDQELEAACAREVENIRASVREAQQAT